MLVSHDKVLYTRAPMLVSHDKVLYTRAPTFRNQQSVMKPYASSLLPYRDMCMVTVYGWK